MLPSLTVVHLHRFMSSGRNHPALFGCVDPSGAPAGDYVVKLVGSMDMRERGAAFEFMASRLAVHFGIKTPEPAQITIDSELATWLSGNNPDLRRILDRSAGPNFGTRLLTDASLWPIGRPVPDAMLPSAIHIFAFDALISNDDRRMDNQNLLVRGDDIFVIDHEAAFAFLYLVASAERAWQCGRRHSLRDHVFFYQLRRQPASLELFTQRLAGLSDTILERLARELPPSWRHEDLGKISDHLRQAREHADAFARNVFEALA
jgi:hypothetical protein